jgi:hypothetical protein
MIIMNLGLQTSVQDMPLHSKYLSVQSIVTRMCAAMVTAHNSPMHVTSLSFNTENYGSHDAHQNCYSAHKMEAAAYLTHL